MLIAAAYLLRCFNDIPALGEVKRVALAEKIFGVERIAGTLQRVQTVTASWGYRAQCQPLMSLVAELLLFQQRPELESLSLDLLASVRTRWQDSNYRSSLYFQLGRALAALGIIAGEPQVRNRSNRELARQARIAGVAHDWALAVERWEATSTLTPRSRAHGRDAILKAGRWLQGAHPEVTRADQWTRELATEYVATVSRMKVGDYVAMLGLAAWVSGATARRRGPPGERGFLCRSAGKRHPGRPTGSRLRTAPMRLIQRAPGSPPMTGGMGGWLDPPPRPLVMGDREPRAATNGRRDDGSTTPGRPGPSRGPLRTGARKVGGEHR